ncbi:MAG: glycosyltransferase [Candidatus Tectomicrobia bacterium]|uniref:Glycosyltransferase n=1 Tax=Tectimicrobiota bacterium TaxID=2528274 RepID=A0A932GSQ0_UNCTE|nr:glycosyltransferase [Candidatus Tectomicrobia bacterium]
MRILICSGAGIDYYKSWPDYVQATGLHEAGHQVSLLCYQVPRSPFPQMRCRKSLMEGIRVWRVKPHRHGLSPGILLALLQQKRPDVIRIHDPKNRLGFLLAWAGNILKIPVVFTPHGLLHDSYIVENTEDPLAGKIAFESAIFRLKEVARSALKDGRFFDHYMNFRMHSAFSKADAIIALSVFEKSLCAQFLGAGKPVKVIPNGILLEFIKKCVRRDHEVMEDGRWKMEDL